MIGRVLRASTMGYTCGTRSSEITEPNFGAFVQTQQRGSDVIAIGLIYAINIDDDPLVRQLIMANNMNIATIRDQRENRMVPVEISVVNVGYMQNGQAFHSLPPRPPLSLDEVHTCEDQIIYYFTQKLDFFRLVLNTPDVPSEELLAAALKHAAASRPLREQREFLVGSGRRLAQLLSHDLTRLNHLLRLIKP